MTKRVMQAPSKTKFSSGVAFESSILVTEFAMLVEAMSLARASLKLLEYGNSEDGYDAYEARRDNVDSLLVMVQDRIEQLRTEVYNGEASVHQIEFTKRQ